MAASLHLGNPLNAYLAVSNLGSSWLSWEILSGVLFAAVGGVFALMQWRKIASFAVRNLIAIVAAVIGLVLIYSMSNVSDSYAAGVEHYRYDDRFLHHHLAVGSVSDGRGVCGELRLLATEESGCADAQCVLLRDALRWIAMASIVLLGVELVTVPLQIAYLAGGTSSAARASAAMMYGEYGLVLGLRLALVFIGAGILGVFIYQNTLSAGREKVMGNLAYAAFALVIVSEVLRSILFYATHVRIGL